MTAKVAAFEKAVKASPAEGRKAACTVPARPKSSAMMSRISCSRSLPFTLQN